MSELNMETVSDDSISLLIDIIQQYDFLYDLGHRDYKNRNKKEQAWAEIAAVVGISVEECKRLWKNARDRFTREKRGQPSGAAAPESNWPYFYKMLFYNKLAKARKTYTRTATKPPIAADESQAKANVRSNSSCSSVSSVWSSVDMIMSPECDSPLEEVEQTMTADARVVVDDDVQSPKASKDGNKVPSGGKRRKSDDDLAEIMNVAKRIATRVEQKPLAEPDTNRTFVLVDYVYSRLSEMSTGEAKKKDKRCYYC